MRLYCFRFLGVAWFASAVAVAITGSANAQTSEQLNPFPPVVENSNQTYFSVGNAPATPAVSSGPTTTTKPLTASSQFFRNSPLVVKASKPLTSSFARSVIEVRDDALNRIALATVVSKKNHIVTKYSLVKDRKSVALQFACGNQNFTGQLVGFDETNDLAIYQLSTLAEDVKKEPPQPVTFAVANPVGFGKIVIAPDHWGGSLAIGLTTRSPIEPKVEECVDCVDFGLTLTDSLLVSRIYPGTAGDRLGIRPNDMIQAVNGKRIFTATEFREIEKATKVGDRLTMDVLRNGINTLISGQIPDRTVADKRDRWGGGPFSRRRFGFSQRILHDSVIAPESCGGPLIDLSGNFQGINIARAYRVASVTLPTDSIRQILMRYLSAEDLEIRR